IQAGAPIKLLVEQAANEWSIVVTNDIQTCADLDGKRLAIHSEGSISGAMVRAYIASECPEAEPEFLIVPGSENRAAALLAGEIDATPAELADKVILVGENPDRFRVLANFAEDLPNLITSVYSTNTELGEDDQAIVRAFLRELLTVHRNVASDPSILGAAAVEYLDSDPAEAATAAEAYLAIDAFALDGGLDPDSVQYTLEFLEGAEQLEPGLTPQDAAAFDILESVLADMGNP
ncbi:MAG TPA: ABC transporter substrate-binding protein, partial [Thermomicrobiales bacterium]|nr:ABC transporter substrate-binding protein [Thermomicrobiales bacterium]